MAHSRTTSALIRNAIKACRTEGVEVGAIDVLPGGAVRILPAGQVPSQSPPNKGNTCDLLFEGESD